MTEPYDFWRRIGSPKLVVAPMVDNSELAYREITRRYGAQLVYTQMFNSNIFSQSKIVRKQLFVTCPSDRPLVVQFAGHDPQTMLAAAKYVEDRCDAVDINLGCPQGIAKRGRYGAFLMEELDLLHDIVSTMVKGLKVPVTCKTRIYHDFDKSIKLLETLANAGASALTVHGRTREEKGHKVREADWLMIRRIKEHFSQRNPPIPIIANGGIETYEDALRCLEITGADAVMSSEAILENPALFVGSLQNHPVKDVIDLTEEYLELCKRHPVFHVKILRSHVIKMLYRYIAENLEIRNMVTQCKGVEDYEAVCRACRAYAALEENQGREWISWYRRHRHGTASVGVLEEADEENGCVAPLPRSDDPDSLLNLKDSFMRGDGLDTVWATGQAEGEEGEGGGGIFDALNMFGSE